jgi:hypothetical protein
LQLDGEGYTLELDYNSIKISPRIEFIEVTDERLKSYWPEGVTRIVFEILNPKLIGKSELVIRDLM